MFLIAFCFSVIFAGLEIDIKTHWNQIEMNRIASVCGIKQNQESNIKINTSFLTPSHLFSISKIKKSREKTRQHQKEWEQKGMRKRVKNCGEGASNWTFKAIAVVAFATLAHAGNGNFSLLFISKDPFFPIRSIYQYNILFFTDIFSNQAIRFENALNISSRCLFWTFQFFSVFFFFCLNR